MKMWTKLFKKEVWCRAIYQDGTMPFMDEALVHKTTDDDNDMELSKGEAPAPLKQVIVRDPLGKHYPSPPEGVEVPARLLCRRCNKQTKPKAKRTHKPYRNQSMDDDEKKSIGVRAMIKRQIMTVQHLCAENIPRTYDVLTRCGNQLTSRADYS